MKKITLHIILVLFCISSNLYAQKFNPDFFVFEDGLWNAKSDTPAYWANLVSEAGFDGMEICDLDKVEKIMPELEKKNVAVYTIYFQIDLDAEQPYDIRLKDYLKKWNGKVPYLWIHVHSKKYSPSDEAGDERCLEIIKEIADIAEPTGVKLAFYPHTGFWVEKVSDAVRLAKKANRKNVGAVFNLCHYLKADNPLKIEQELKKAIPYLFLVSINGADDGDTNEHGWDRLIQPLGDGTFDVKNFLQLLKNYGYNSPVGLQCYNIKGKPEDFLKSSVEAWESYITGLNSEK